MMALHVNGTVFSSHVFSKYKVHITVSVWVLGHVLLLWPTSLHFEQVCIRVVFLIFCVHVGC